MARRKKKKSVKGVKGLVGWVGKVGFRKCVRSLSTKKKITNPTKVCGWLKGRANATGVLSKAHSYKKGAKK